MAEVTKGTRGKFLDRGGAAYNPKGEGAAGDNTTDDVVAFQATVDKAIAAGGGTVIVAYPFAVSDVIEIRDATNVTIRFHYGAVRKTLGTSAAGVFRFVNCTDCGIEGIGTIDGGYTGVSTGSNPAVQIGAFGTESGMLNERVSIKGVTIKNGNHACIGIYGETDTGVEGNRDITLSDLHLSRAGTGVFVYKGLKGLHMSNVRCSGVGAAGLVLDTRSATDADTVNSFPISHVRVQGLTVDSTAGDAGFEPRAVVVKGAVTDVLIDGYDFYDIVANDTAARNTYGVLIAESHGPGSGATATATVSGGAVTAFTVTAGGTGYTTPPTVFISSALGGGAQGTAVLTAGVVTSITVDAGGTGYTEAPYVQLISGEVGGNIQVLNGSMNGIRDDNGTTGWPVYVQSGFRDVRVDGLRAKDCRRGIVVEGADSVQLDHITFRDLPLQASTYPIQVIGATGIAPATNLMIDHVHADLGEGLSTITHPITLTYADGVRLGRDITHRGFATGKLNVSTTNVKRLSGAEGSSTVDPANLADGGGATYNVTAAGAEVGDFAEAAFSEALQGMQMTAWVSAANVVSVRLQNETGGAIDLASGTLRVRASKS